LDLKSKKAKKLPPWQAYSRLHYQTKLKEIIQARWKIQYLAENPDHEQQKPIPQPPLAFRNGMIQELYKNESPEIKRKVEEERDRAGTQDIEEGEDEELDPKERARRKKVVDYQKCRNPRLKITIPNIRFQQHRCAEQYDDGRARRDLQQDGLHWNGLIRWSGTCAGWEYLGFGVRPPQLTVDHTKQKRQSDFTRASPLLGIASTPHTGIMLKLSVRRFMILLWRCFVSPRELPASIYSTVHIASSIRNERALPGTEHLTYSGDIGKPHTRSSTKSVMPSVESLDVEELDSNWSEFENTGSASSSDDEEERYLRIESRLNMASLAEKKFRKRTKEHGDGDDQSNEGKSKKMKVC
jgi:hypothetical protein